MGGAGRGVAGGGAEGVMFYRFVRRSLTSNRPQKSTRCNGVCVPVCAIHVCMCVCVFQ